MRYTKNFILFLNFQEYILYNMQNLWWNKLKKNKNKKEIIYLFLMIYLINNDLLIFFHFCFYKQYHCIFIYIFLYLYLLYLFNSRVICNIITVNENINFFYVNPWSSSYTLYISLFSIFLCSFSLNYDLTQLSIYP